MGDWVYGFFTGALFALAAFGIVWNTRTEPPRPPNISIGYVVAGGVVTSDTPIIAGTNCMQDGPNRVICNQPVDKP